MSNTPHILTPAEAARLIDHTLLKPEATASQIAKLCAEAVEHNFFSVMINPGWIAECRRILGGGSTVKIGTVIGFPLGATTTKAKLAEAAEAIELGAHELDMVINVGALKSGSIGLVQGEIAQLAELCHEHGAHLKTILEMCLLTEEEKLAACRVAEAAGADFVKTSTGFSTSGATVADIKLMRAAVSPKIGVKAAGGIRNAKDFLALADAGANRIGASAGIQILAEIAAMQA